MTTEVWVSVITSVPTLIAAIVSIIVNNRLIGYKVDELAKRVEKHNGHGERIAVVERDMKTTFNAINDIKEELKDLREK